MRKLLLFVSAICMAVSYGGCAEVVVTEPDGPGTEEGTGEEPGGDDSDTPTGDIPEGFEEEPDDPVSDFNITFDYSVLARAGHPRLLIDKEGFEDLKTKVTTGRFTYKTLYKLHQEVLSRARQIVSSDRGFTGASDHYTIVDNLLSCSYAYRMTGQSAYLVKAKGDLATVCGYANWVPSGLSVGEISLAVAIAYDWLYYDLGLEERTVIHNAMVDKGIRQVYSKNMSSSIGNWNSIILGGAACASLAVYEKDKEISVKQIEKAVEENKIAMKGIYSPDGNYAEGCGYWEYGTGFEVCFLTSLQDIFGHTAGLMEVPGFMESGKYALYTHGTMNTQFSYCDGGGTTDSPFLTSWWFAAMQDDPTLAFCEARMLDEGNYSDTKLTDTKYRLLPAMIVMMRDFDIDSRTMSPPAEEIWHGAGEMPVVMVRRGWNYDETDVFLGIKAGHCNTWKTSGTAHGHMDAGSFVFEAEGVRWSDDIMRPSYSAWFAALQAAGSRSGDTSQTGLRWDTFRVNNLCHSTIVSYSNDGSVPDKLHPSDFYVDGFATIDEVIDAGGRQGAVVDMTGPMKGQVSRATRTIELVDGTDLVVTDEITALPSLDCELEWRMLSITNATVTEEGITLTKNGRSRTLAMTSSDPSITPEYRKWSTVRPSDWTPRDWDQAISDRTIVGWSVTVPAGRTVRIVTTLASD